MSNQAALSQLSTSDASLATCLSIIWQIALTGRGENVQRKATTDLFHQKPLDGDARTLFCSFAYTWPPV